MVVSAKVQRPWNKAGAASRVIGLYLLPLAAAAAPLSISPILSLCGKVLLLSSSFIRDVESSSLLPLLLLLLSLELDLMRVLKKRRLVGWSDDIEDMRDGPRLFANRRDGCYFNLLPREYVCMYVYSMWVYKLDYRLLRLGNISLDRFFLYNWLWLSKICLSHRVRSPFLIGNFEYEE